MPDPLDLSQYVHVIWDWNGTLLNDVDVARDAVNGMLRRRGLSPVNREQYQAAFDFPIEDYYQRLGFDFEIEPFSALAAEFHQAYQHVWRTCGLRPGADQSLRLAAEGGVQQSLLSASEQTALEQHVAHYRLRDRFSRLVGSLFFAPFHRTCKRTSL